MHSNHHPAVIPIVVPTGRKHASSYISSITAQNHIYNKNDDDSSFPATVGNSPDKGGVCLAIPSLSLLICSLHLCGTNEYHTMESKFDQIRIDELKKIGSKCHEALLLSKNYQKNQNHHDNDDDKSTIDLVASSSLSSSLEDYTKIILGDLNFRVEIATSTTTTTTTTSNTTNQSDKGRGGREYQQVYNILQSQSSQKVRDLFWNHDRLVKLMQNDNERNKILLLNNMNDVLMNSNQFKSHGKGTKNYESNTIDMNNMIYPTFKFQTKSSKGQEQQYQTKQKIQSSSSLSSSLENIVNRKYSDKRIPSWTDRILLDDRLINHQHHPCFEIKNLEANYDICTSDHVPVCCIIEQKM